jgi:hypothetical protein
LLLTDGPYYGHTSTSTIRLANGHLSLQPHSILNLLLVKRGLVDVDDLLTCLHQLRNIHHCLYLVFGDLILLLHLATVGVLGLDIPDLVSLVEVRQGLNGNLDAELLFNEHHPVLKREMGPLNQRLLVRQEPHDLRGLPLCPIAMSQPPVDELVAVLDPLLHKLVGPGLPDASDLLDLAIGVPSWPWFSE